MRKFVRSETYLRTRLVTGTMFVLLGGLLLGQIVARFGPDWHAIPAYVLGLALILLGLNRWREYYMARRKR
jgi:hypothetical protein